MRGKQIVSFTASAVKQLFSLRRPGHISMFRVESRGCAGGMQVLRSVPNDKLTKFDEKIQLSYNKHRFNVAVEANSVLKMIGTEIDFKETELFKGFVFNNPQRQDKLWLWRVCWILAVFVSVQHYNGIEERRSRERYRK